MKCLITINILLLFFILICFFLFLFKKRKVNFDYFESKYKTNDIENRSYDLRKKINSNKSDFIDKGIEISVIIPCYNEAQRITSTLISCIEYLKINYQNQFEILIIDDGSTDNTLKVVCDIANQMNLKPHTLKYVKFSVNMGKGCAVKQGILHSYGRLCLFMDADGATKFSELSKLTDFLKTLKLNEPGIAIGSRSHLQKNDSVIKRSFLRKLLMIGFHMLVLVFGVKKVTDTQCGFKLFNYYAVKSIFPHLHSKRWIFDVEILLLAQFNNIKINEVHVSWCEVGGSKMNLVSDSISMAIDLILMRISYLLGIYKLDECGELRKKEKNL